MTPVFGKDRGEEVSGAFETPEEAKGALVRIANTDPPCMPYVFDGTAAKMAEVLSLEL